MATVSPPPRPAEVDDDLGSLLNYDLDLLDAPDNGKAGSDTRNGQPATSAVNTAGADEEITIVKKRAPIAKLDDARLLSAAGIPKLRKIHKQKLRFKGKGHEFSDVARLLNMYQLWLDDLYPRAKFADALAMVEKLGHSKRMQMMRKQWIDEGRPKPLGAAATDQGDANDDNALVAEDLPAGEIAPASSAGDAARALHRSSSTHTHTLAHRNPTAHEQEPAQHEHEHEQPPSDAHIQGPRHSLAPAEGPGEEEPDMDELDALLEQDATAYGRIHDAAKAQQPAARTMPVEDEFADEMEAMAGMEDPW